jgi:hypothetical protein
MRLNTYIAITALASAIVVPAYAECGGKKIWNGTASDIYNASQQAGFSQRIEPFHLRSREAVDVSISREDGSDCYGRTADAIELTSSTTKTGLVSNAALIGNKGTLREVVMQDESGVRTTVTAAGVTTCHGKVCDTSPLTDYWKEVFMHSDNLYKDIFKRTSK